MKIRNVMIPMIIKQVAVAFYLCQAFTAKATVELGAAGPSNWAVLEIGNGNVSIANASDAGFITGNVGIGSGGSISDSGTPIQGNVVTYGSKLAQHLCRGTLTRLSQKGTIAHRARCLLGLGILKPPGVILIFYPVRDGERRRI